jgi:hypothetical protein
VASITAKEGKTLFAFTNEVFERAIEAYEMNTQLAETLEFFRMLKNGKNLGYVFVPSDILNSMTKKFCTVERERLLKDWYESGEYNGNYLGIRFHDQSKPETIKSFLKAVLWNMDEILVKVDKGQIEMKCFCPSLNPECTEMLASFLHGMFTSLGYTMLESKSLRGIIMMRLEGEKEAKPRIPIAVES